jgi:hypothetical protein
MPFEALFSVHANEVLVRCAIGDGMAASEISALRVPRMAVAAFEAAISTRLPAVAVTTSDEPFIDGLLQPLRGNRSAAFVMPIAIGKRTVALMVGHADGRALADFAEILPLAEVAGSALARVIAARSKNSRLDLEYEIELTVSEVGIDGYMNAICAGFLFGIIGWGLMGIGGFVGGATIGVAAAALRSWRVFQPRRQPRPRRHGVTQRVR